MSDPRWYARLPRWKRQIVDQSAHLGIGAGAALLAGGLALIRLRARWAALIGGLVGTLSGVVREVVQNVGDSDNRVWDAVLDAGVWGIGGALGALGVWGIGRAIDRGRARRGTTR